MKLLSIIFSLLLVNSICISQTIDFNDIKYLKKNSGNKDNIYGEVKKETKLRIGDSPLDKIIHTFVESDSVLLIDFKGGYWGVKYEEELGYISDLYIVESDEIEEFKQEKIEVRLFENKMLTIIDSLDNNIEILKNSLQDSINKIERSKRTLYEEINIRKLENFENLSVENQWELLLKIGGCLTGGQYCENDKCGGEGCVMSNSKYWKTFLVRPREETVDFLINEIADTTETKIHTCPFFAAKTGEVAIYSLQFIYRTNWDDLSQEYKRFKEVEKTGIETSYQTFIWKIIEEEKELKKMQENWRKLK